MAKRKRGPHSESKSAAIRDYRQQHPNAKPKEIAAALNTKGANITPGYVSVVLSSDRRRGKGRRRKPAATAGAAVAGRASKTASMAELKLVKQLVRQSGSVAAAKSVVAAYEELMA